jgi:hypothetical protein
MTTVALFLALLALRILAAHYAFFFQNDEVSIAAGTAALLNHSIADTYRYGPQAGYYRLVQGLSWLLGGARWVPGVMITLSAIAGTVIPFSALGFMPRQLERRERVAMALLIAINPILWMSSTYGNSTMPATALLALAAMLLSREPSRGTEAGALALFAAAVFVRADTILATPAIAVLLWQRYGAVRPAMLRLTSVALGLAALYAIMFLVDPRMASTVSAVTSHLTNRFQTHFWDYLLWGTSPFILALAVVGLVRGLESRRPAMAVVAAWCLPFFAFYFAATTTPRYFIPTVVPLALLSAIGVVALPRLFAPRERLAGIVTAAACAAPLFVGLGWFSPSSWKTMLKEAEFETQVGPMWTGAFLYKSYVVPGVLERSIRHPAFGLSEPTQAALDTSLQQIASGSRRGHTVVALLGGWNGQVFHYYANLYGAHYESVDPGQVFATKSWMTLGGARVMSIAVWDASYGALAQLPVAQGDEVWIMAWSPQAQAGAESKLPAGASLAPLGPNAGPVHRFLVQAHS